MRKYKILGIAPNENIYFLMLEAAKSYSQIIIDAFIGNLEDGCDIVRQRGNDYDCIISRGGTAQQIRTISSQSVVEIEFSAYDLLQSINLARSSSEKWAVVGFPSITKNARIISDLLQYSIDIFTLNASEDVNSVFMELKAMGFQIIVCDTITDIFAKRQGIDSILIHSGVESVERAIDEAVNICDSNAQIKEQKDLYEMLLGNLKIDAFVFNAEKHCVYSSTNPVDKAELHSIVLEQISLPATEQSDVIHKKIRNAIYNIERKQVDFRNEIYTLYTIYHQKSKTAKRVGGIQYYTANELNTTVLSDFYLSPRFPLSKYEQLGEIGVCPPLVILGQPGTGKKAVSAYFHIKGKNWNKPYIDCDFSQINEKELQHLISNLDSPFWSNQMTFYFQNMESMNDRDFDELLSVLHFSHLCNRNRIIFSWTHSRGEHLPNRIRRIMDQFTCFSILMPSVQERIDEIPQMVSKYINFFNSTMAKQSAGLLPEAIALLKVYHWPGNLSQLKRVLFQAFLESSGLYITPGVLQPIIEGEKRYSISEQQFSIDLKGTLDEIKRGAVRIVLAQCGNNQRKAAERLGISRSTLWRMLSSD